MLAARVFLLTLGRAAVPFCTLVRFRVCDRVRRCDHAAVRLKVRAVFSLFTIRAEDT